MKSMNLKGKGNRTPTTTHKPDFRKMTDKGQDTHFSYNMTVLIGCSAEVTTRNGEKYEGIFVAYSATQEIMLEAAHLISSENDESAISTHYDVLVIPSDKLMAMKFENAVLNYATREFQTDTAISCGKHTSAINRELTPWDGGETEAADGLDLTVDDVGTNGWAPDDMFKKNAEKYGVVSSYDKLLSGYTTSLDKTDTETFKKHEEQALQIAEEIERNTTSVERSTVENGDDEEAKFSAVVRDNSYSNSNLNHNNNNTNNDNRTDKYVPPSRRNQNQNTQLSQPPPPLNSNMPSGPPNHHMQQQSSGGGNRDTRKPSYGGGGPRNNYTSSSNTFYQQDARRNFDRRGPMQPPYGPSSSHGDSSSRGGRGGKSPMDRRGPPGRDEVKKDLMDFQPPFSLGNPDNHRQSSFGPNLSQHHSSPMNHGMSQSGGPGQQSGPNAQNGPSTNSPSSAALRSQSLSQKGEKEKSVPLKSPAADVGSPKVEKSEKVQTPQPLTAPETPTRKPSDTAEAVCESSSEEKHVSVASPAPSETRSVSGSDTAKSIDSTDSKKPFAFNVNAKEFNPTAKSFTPRSPATPPRPPSTPASTAQLMPVTQGHTPYIQMPPGAIYLAPPYSQTISPVASQGLASNNLPPPRHMNPHRKSMGVSQRADLQSTIPVQAAGPLLAQGSLQNNGQTHQYAAYGIPHQHGYHQPVRIHAPNIVQMYNTEVGGEGHAIQLPLHYIHSGAAAGGHPSNQQPTVNVSGQNAVISGSPHGYTQTGGSHGPHQHHISYPFVGVPVVGVGYSHPHAPNQLLNQRQYYD